MAVRFGFHTVPFSPLFGGTGSVLDVIAAAAAAGFEWLGVDVASLSDGVAEAMADAGLRCSDVAAVRIDHADGPDSPAAVGRAAAALGAPVAIGAVVPAVPWASVVQLTASATAVLADHGCRLAIEFVPYGPVQSLAAAQRLADETGCGIVVDSFHVFRSGVGWDSLRPELVAAVQWSDGPASSSLPWLEESRTDRRLPGDGAFPLPSLATALRWNGVVTAEVLSTRLRDLGPHELARRTMAALQRPTSGWR